MVTVSKNTVYSVFFLILVFVSVSVLFIMIGAEFLGMIMLIVYVGAVAVLFLFVVMMLNVSQISKRNENKGFINNLSVGLIVAAIIFLELLVVVGGWKYKGTFIHLSSDNLNLTNSHAIGNVLYTDYILLFQVSGMILLVSMIGAITLTLRERTGVKKQIVNSQTDRKISDVIEVIKVNSKE